MKRSIYTSILLAVLLAVLPKESFSQADAFKVNFGGFVKTDAYYDTRQVISLREGHIHLWPANEELDANGEDIKEGGNFHILSIQSRVFTKAEGPGIFGGKTTGYIEAEYLGSTDATINSLRLRHAYVDLDFDHLQIKAGQFWHPLFSTINVPDVISFNTGIPFIPFNRSPQIKFTGKFGNFKPYIAFVGQRDFSSDGPSGGSNSYIRNAGIPEIAAGMDFTSSMVSFGLGLSTKALQPYSVLTIDNEKFKNDDQIRTFNATGSIRVKSDKFHIKTQATYAQNASELLMIGGYATHIDEATKSVEFTPISSFSGWLELMWKDKWEFGTLFGMTQNLGASDDVKGAVYGRGLDIDNVMKVYPRIAYNFNKTKIGIEGEWTKAAYGKKISTTNKEVENTKDITNMRVLLAFYVFF